MAKEPALITHEEKTGVDEAVLHGVHETTNFIFASKTWWDINRPFAEPDPETRTIMHPCGEFVYIFKNR